MFVVRVSLEQKAQAAKRVSRGRKKAGRAAGEHGNHDTRKKATNERRKQMKRLNRGLLRTVGLMCPVLCCATVWAQRVERVSFYDRHDNMLFYVTYDYNEQNELVSRSLYDLNGYFLRKITSERDGSGNITREDYRNFDDQKITYTKYSYDGSKTTMSIFDNYTQNPFSPTVASYSPAGDADGAFDFLNADGAKTHRLQYHRDGEGKVTRIDVLDAGGTKTHYARVQRQGDAGAITGGAVAAGGSRVSGIRVLAGGTISFSISLPRRQKVSAVLYDMQGRSGAALLERRFGTGTHSVKLRTLGSPETMPAGVYVLRVSLEDAGTEINRMIQLLR